MLDLKSVVDGDVELFAVTPGRRSADYSPYLPVLKLSSHARDESGRGAVKQFPSTWGEFAGHTKGLRWAARQEGCSVATRWAPADAKRHAAILKSIGESSDDGQRAKLQERLDALEGWLNFRTFPTIPRSRQAV